jgi:adenylate cyclase class 2
MEIEAKLSVTDHDTVRRALAEQKAKQLSRVVETNHILDAADHSLRSAGKGLRVRINHSLDDDQEEVVLTVKGPLLPGALKTREEHEIVVNDAKESLQFLATLGFVPVLTFEKRRETWELDNCKVELDEIPHLGKFVEIEGPSEADVIGVQKKLKLESLPVIKTSYVGMIAKWMGENGAGGNELKFAGTEEKRS